MLGDQRIGADDALGPDLCAVEDRRPHPDQALVPIVQAWTIAAWPIVHQAPITAA